jgi:hypothetical protein
MKIIPKWVVSAITEFKKKNSKLSTHYNRTCTSVIWHAVTVTSGCISEHTEASQRRLSHYHTGLVFEDEGEDENGNMLGDASPLHT